MGFFDTVKDKAGALAADTQRAGKVTAAQARLAVLQNDLRKAERELGHAAFAVAERGELEHPDLAHAVARVRATTSEVRAKEAEISALRGETPQKAVPAAAAPAEPAAAETPAKKPATRKPAAGAAAKPAAKKPAAKKAAPKKAAAKKTPAAPKVVPPATPRKQNKAGATPKKSTRPPSSGPRPAGKNRPAGT